MGHDKASCLMGGECGKGARLEPLGAVAQHLLVALFWVVCVCTPGSRWESVRCQTEP